MKTDDAIGFIILAFLAGSLVTMILFALMDQNINKKYPRRPDGTD